MSNSSPPPSTLSVHGTDYTVYDITKAGLGDLKRFPLLDSSISKLQYERRTDLMSLTLTSAFAGWESRPSKTRPEIPSSLPVLVWQDLTGGAAIADFAAMRDVFQSWKLDPQQINPLVQTDLVVDYSVQVSVFRLSLCAQILIRTMELRKRESFPPD